MLENYSQDPEIKCLVDSREFYFIPVVNPDGYFYNQLVVPGGGGLWRLNLRNNADGSVGVDLNRNYGFIGVMMKMVQVVYPVLKPIEVLVLFPNLKQKRLGIFVISIILFLH